MGSGATTPPAGPLPLYLRRSWFNLNQAFRRRIAHLRLTPDQYTALRTLSEGPQEGMTQRELASRMASDPNTVASLVERMAVAGLIERAPHERDGRAMRVRLRTEGLASFGRARVVAEALQEEVQSGFSQAERRLLLTALARLAEGCQKALARSPRGGLDPNR